MTKGPAYICSQVLRANVFEKENDVGMFTWWLRFRVDKFNYSNLYTYKQFTNPITHVWSCLCNQVGLKIKAVNLQRGSESPCSLNIYPASTDQTMNFHIFLKKSSQIFTHFPLKVRKNLSKSASSVYSYVPKYQWSGITGPVIMMMVMMMMVVMVMMTKQLTDATVEPRLKSPGDKLQLGEPAQQQPPHNGDDEDQLFFKLSMSSSASPCHKV